MLEVRAGGGRGPHQQPERETHDQRLDARLQRDDPHRAADQEVRRPAPQLEPEQQHHHHQRDYSAEASRPPSTLSSSARGPRSVSTSTKSTKSPSVRVRNPSPRISL